MDETNGSLSEFSMPQPHFNPTGWGPLPDNIPERYQDLPYASFSKGDYIGRAADFVSAHRRRRGHSYAGHNDGKNADFQYRVDSKEDETFDLVDRTKTRKQKFPARKNQAQTRRDRERRERERRERDRGGRPQVDRRHQQQPRRRGQKGRPRNYGSGGHRSWHRRSRIDRDPSVQVQASWELREEIDLSEMSKFVANEPRSEDLRWAGFLDKYNEAYDKIKVRSAKPLRKYTDRDFFYVSSTDDPVFGELVANREGDVFITDTILAHLVTCSRSVYPWDIVVHKTQTGMLLFDKRDGPFDLLTVSETAMDPPTNEDANNINSPERLAYEATMINQNFSQQVLSEDQALRKTMEFPHPFLEDDDEEEPGAPKTTPAAVAYRYRRFDLGEGRRMIVRCELHAYTAKKGEEQMMTTYALNEWDPKQSNGVDFRQKLDTQPVAVLGTEMKNNSAKVARWSVQSVLAGASIMRLGFVARRSRSDPTSHVVLGTRLVRPRDFAAQMQLSVQNIWGVVKMFVTLFSGVEEGKYVIMRDPNKATLRLYQVPLETFEESEEEDEEEPDEDDDEGDEEDEAEE